MMRQRKKKTRAKRVRFPGIGAFAEKAGVNRSHAYRVLVGERKSPRLQKLWREFKTERRSA